MDDDDDEEEYETVNHHYQLVLRTITPIKDSDGIIDPVMDDVDVPSDQQYGTGRRYGQSQFDVHAYDDNNFEPFLNEIDQNDEGRFRAWRTISARKIQACLKNMGIKWAPKEHDIGTKFKRKEDDEHKRRVRVCTTLTTNTILDMDGPLGYKRVDKLNYTHLPQQKLTKYASCQLCRFLGEPDDKLQKVKSNIAYCSDCNVHLCMNCYKPFHCQADIVSDGAKHAWRMYLCLRKEENEGGVTNETARMYFRGWNFQEEKEEKTKKRKANQRLVAQWLGEYLNAN